MSPRAKTRAALAYHEAGHAVVAWAFNVRLRSVSIVRDAKSSGRVFHARTFSKEARRRLLIQSATLANFEGEAKALRLAVICLAGMAAQRMYAPKSVRHFHGTNDYLEAIELAECAASYDEKEIHHWFLRAQRRAELILEKHWRCVEALANALLVKPELSGAEATEVIFNAHG